MPITYVRCTTVHHHFKQQAKYLQGQRKQYLMPLMGTTPFHRMKPHNLLQCSSPNGDTTNTVDYTCHFDEIISTLPQKTKVVDDCLLYNYSIEQAFWHAWDFLDLCAKHGITVCIENFQFCRTKFDSNRNLPL